MFFVNANASKSKIIDAVEKIKEETQKIENILENSHQYTGCPA